MKLKSNVTFRLEQRKDKTSSIIISDNVPIILDFTFDGHRLQIYTGVRIDTGKWDQVTQRVKRNSYNAAGYSATEINEILERMRITITDLYKEAKILRTNLTPAYIRNEFRNRIQEKSVKTYSFIDRLNEFIASESIKNSWTAGTKSRFETLVKQIDEFQKNAHFKIEFDDINDAFFIKFMDYFRDILGHRNSTLAKKIKMIKWFMNWATKKGYNKKTNYAGFKTNLKGTSRNGKIIFLTWDELMHLYQLPIPKTYLEHVRDVFCFCCFTGLRYSDAANLKRSNIKGDTIEFTSIKTDETLYIDLNDFSRAILDKYAHFPTENDLCLPVISNQKMNDYLKELGQLAGFDNLETVVYYKGALRVEETYKKWELLTTHVGRKTFVTNALFLNIPSEVIQQWTGHKDHKIFEKYYKIVDQQRRSEMNKFNR